MKKILLAFTKETNDIINNVKQTNKYPTKDINILLLVDSILRNIDHKYLSILDPIDNKIMNFESLKNKKSHNDAKLDENPSNNEYFIIGNNIAAYYSLYHNNINIVNKGPELKLINSKAIDVDFEKQDKQEFIDTLKSKDWYAGEAWKESLVRVMDVDEILSCPNCKSKIVFTPVRNKSLVNNMNILVTIVDGKIISMNSDFETNAPIEQFNIHIDGLSWEAIYFYVEQHILPYLNSSAFLILDVLKNDTHYGLDINRIISFVELSDDLSIIPVNLLTHKLHYFVDNNYTNKDCKDNQIKLAMAEFVTKFDQNIIDPFKLPDSLIKRNNYKIVNEKSETLDAQKSSIAHPSFDQEYTRTVKTKNQEQTFLKENEMFINERNDNSCSKMNVNDQSYDHSSSNEIMNDERSETPQEFSDSKNDHQNHEKNKIFNHTPNDHSAGRSENETDNQVEELDTSSYNLVKFKQKDYSRAIKLFKDISIEHNITEDNSIFYTIYKGGIPLAVRYFNQLDIRNSRFGIITYQRFDGPKNKTIESVELLSPHKTIESESNLDIKHWVIFEDLIDSGITLEKALDFFSKYIKDFEKYQITLFCIHASYEALDLINKLPYNINIVYYNLKTKNDWIVYPWE